MGLDAALAWETCTFGMTKKLPCLDSLFTKMTIELYCDLWKLLFSRDRDNSGNSIDLILVGKCPLSVIRL